MMTRKSSSLANCVLTGLAAVIVPATVSAQENPSAPCELEISGDTAIEWRGLYGRGYEVTGTQQEFETLAITVRHDGAACDFFIVATPTSSGAESVLTGATDRLAWDLLQTTNGPSLVSKDFLGSLDDRIQGSFADGLGAKNLTLFFAIPAGQFVRGGHYRGDFVVRLFRLEHGLPELAAEWPVAALAPVPSILQVRSDTFPGASRETRFDLGSLNTPSTRSVDFDIVSNASILATFQSTNRGVLAHEYGGPGVPYRLHLNGAEVPLGGVAAQRLDMVSPDGQRGARVEIVVPPAATPFPAGRYSDTLTITFTADP